MNFLIASAMAQDAAQQPSAMPSIIMLVLIVVVFWFLLIRPQMKRNKEHRELVANLSKGEEIVTAGGLLGRITAVGESFLTVELADNLTVKVQKHSVTQVVPKGTVKSAD